MAFPDIVSDLKAKLPQLRGRLLPNEPLAPLTWFRVGGPAQVLFMPEDEADLSYFLSKLSAGIAVTVVGLGSNLIVRDRGVPGVVIRLGRGFSDIKVEGERIRTGTAVPDLRVAQAAQKAGLAGLAFLRGIPGAIGGALRMNGGAYGRETKDTLVEARGVDRAGQIHVFANGDMHYTYRHCGVPDDIVFTEALFQGRLGDPAAIAAEMDKITESREATQPIKSRTGGSTFKNPARSQGLAAHRCRRLPRAHRRRCAGLGAALQFPDQPRQRHCRRHRDAGRNRPQPREGDVRRGTRVGDQADRGALTLRRSGVRRSRGPGIRDHQTSFQRCFSNTGKFARIDSGRAGECPRARNDGG